MSYMHIENLYRAEGQDILLFKRCYAMEKIDGTSAHLSWKDGQLKFFAGGSSHAVFCALFDAEALSRKLTESAQGEVVVFGEAYGGKLQGKRVVYGPNLKFIAFEVKIGDLWLSVPQAAAFVASLGLEFVHYVEISTDLAEIDAQRDAPSVQAERNGCGVHPREGVILRPLIELRKNNGQRIIAKHKTLVERETASPRSVGEVDPAKRAALENAEAVAREYVVAKRLQHVLGGLPQATGLEQARDVINAMCEDVQREASGEIVWDKDVARAVGRLTMDLFKRHLAEKLREETG